MKKASLADQIEQKIRLMNDRYKHLKNCSSENVLRQHSLPKNSTNDLIRQDLKSHLPILKFQVSRDVSHLQKHKSPKATSTNFSFPTDINKLKTFLEFQIATETSPHYSLKSAVPEAHARKASGMEEQTIEFLEKIDHGHPSSRKAAENLMNWFLDMKTKHETEEDFESVVVLCEQELVKSVWAECKTRGNLLKLIFAHYHSASIKNKEQAEGRIQGVIQAFEEQANKQSRKFEELNQKLANKGQEIVNIVKNHEEIVKNLEEDVIFFKKKLQDMQKLYLDEQELWKKQWMHASRRRTVQPNVVLLHSSYKLAVTKLRGDLFGSPIPTEPVFPEDLKKKIENGEALDINELQQYRDAYLQYQQEIENSQFCDAEVQTDEIFKETEEQIQTSYRTSVQIDEFLQVHSRRTSESYVKIEVNEKNERVEKEFFFKETQTDEFEDLIEQLNDSELAEIQELLQNDVEDVQEGEEEGLAGSKLGNWMGLLASRGLHSHVGFAVSEKDELGVVGSVGSRDVLDVVEESGLEQDLQNSLVSEEKSENFKSDVELNAFQEIEKGGHGKNYQGVNKNAQGVKNVDKNGLGVNRNIQGVDKNLKGTDKISQGADKNFQSVDKNFQGVDKIVQGFEKNVQNSDKSAEFIENKNKIKSVKDKSEVLNTDKKSKFKRNSQVIKISNLFSSPKPPGSVSTPKTIKSTSFSEATSPKVTSFSETTTPKHSSDFTNPKNFLNEVKDKLKIPLKPPEEVKSIENSTKIAKNSTNPSEKLKKIDLEGIISEDESDEDSFESPQAAAFNPENRKDQNSDFFSGSKSGILSEAGGKSIESNKGASQMRSSLKIKDPKRNSYLINIKQASERRGSMPLVLNHPALALKDIKEGSVSANMKLTTLSLITKIQQKKKELAELERKIEDKKKALIDSFESDSSDSSIADQSLNPAKRFSASDLLKGVLKRVSLSVPETPEDQRRKSVSVSLVKSLLKEELKKRGSANIEVRRRSFAGDPIEEEDEDEDEYQEFDSKLWKDGYKAGFARGSQSGFHTGKTLGREEAANEAYAKPAKDFGNTSLTEDQLFGKNLIESPNSSQFKWKKGQAFDTKSNKELTKFAEFKFAKQKNVVFKPPSPAPELIKVLMRKSKEALERKAKAGKKMVNKIIANTYNNAIAKSGVESPEELLEICYEEFSQRYGLKKVTDRKFMEFIASLLKVKNYKKPAMFIKLTGFGKAINLQTYSKFTVNLYLNSLHYMLTSKIGITMNYEESEDKNMFPINRGSECVKDKLEGIVDRNTLQNIINTLESKSVPDPQRISTALIELEYVLELICENYEIQQKKVVKGAKTVFKALGYEENALVLQYDFALAVRFICPAKFNRMESEENVVQELNFDEVLEICVDMNVLSEHDLAGFVKGYGKVPFVNCEELMGIVEKMGKVNRTWISVEDDKWRERLSGCLKRLEPSSQLATIVWRIYESELRRIESEYLH